MKSVTKGIGPMSLRARRRVVASAAYALVTTSVAFGAATARGPATTTSRPAVAATAGAKAAAQTQYLKAKDLYDAGKYAEAQIENERALVLDPANGDAALMKRILEAKLAGGGMVGSATSGTPGKLTPLTTTQMSLIRVYEMSPQDQLRGKIDRAVLEEFWNDVYIKDPLLNGGDTSKQSHDAYLNANNFAKQLYVFKRANQQKYLEKVTVNSDPAILTAFRTGVHTYMMANCATSECHGGDKAGNFRLMSTTGTGAAPAEVVYTNFYIMSMYSGKDGKMIDRDTPEKSLFLQYSLPWASAVVKHPKVDLKKIPNTQDTRLRSMLEWVRALTSPRPEYGITYEVPGMKDTSLPRDVPTTTRDATAPK